MISEFAKEKVFWTRKMNVKLVKFIESKPNIWNPRHPKYTSVDYRDRTYAEFAAKYGNEFSGLAVKHRWTNIRSTFCNYMRKVNASRKKPDSEEYKVNWHLWEPCQFLLKVNRKSKGQISTDTCENGDDNSKLFAEVDADNYSSDNNKTDVDEHGTESVKCRDIANNLLNVFKGVQNDAFGIENTKNGKIGRTVDKKLSQMNSLDAARMCAKITDILLLYEENNPLNPNNLKEDLDHYTL